MTRPEVLTGRGGLRGIRHGSVDRYLGVPFARLRHRFAEPDAISWSGLRDAARHGPAPWQQPSPMPIGADIGDDSLHLAIWAPVEADRAPVLLWVYGGGFEAGSNAMPPMDGARLAAESGCVVVALNHRVGAYGFAQLDQHGGRLASASNLGLRDVVAALDWVDAEIAAFGGDPAQITVMGASSGSFLATALLAVPRSRAQLRRAVLISGAASRLVPVSTARGIGDALVAELRLPDAQELVDLEPARVLAAQSLVIARDIGERNAQPPRAYGVVDDSELSTGLLTAHPFDAVASGATSGVELFVVATRDETELWRRLAPDAFAPADAADLAREVAAWGAPADRAAEIAAHYLDGASPGEARSRLLTDWIYRMPAARLALAHAAGGGVSRLAMIGRVGDEPAGHGSEVGLFGNVPNEPAVTDRDEALRRAVCAFASGHDPGWPALGDDVGHALMFGEGDAATEYATALDIWAGVPRR